MRQATKHRLDALERTPAAVSETQLSDAERERLLSDLIAEGERLEADPSLPDPHNVRQRVAILAALLTMAQEEERQGHETDDNTTT